LKLKPKISVGEIKNTFEKRIKRRSQKLRVGQFLSKFLIKPLGDGLFKKVKKE
jgi:hypothetical protein